MDTEYMNWETWLLAHKAAAKKLLAGFTCRVSVDTGEYRPEIMNLPASVLACNAALAGQLVERKCQRVHAEAILLDLGYMLREEITEETKILQLRGPNDGTNIAQFSGSRRWHAALQHALEEWEKVQ